MIDPAFWSGKRVLVTGHTGFKGSWLILLLNTLGAEVYGFSLAPETPSLFSDLSLESRCMRHQVGSIDSPEAIAAYISEVNPDVVLHLAAQPLVRASYENPIQTYQTNVMGTAHVLDACRLAPAVKAVVVITTDKVYENQEWEWPYRENDRLGGHDPYSSSKACAEYVLSAYAKSFLISQGIGVATVRAGNVIGGGDWAANRLVPDIVRAYASGEMLTLRFVDATRPWQHVLEPLGGYLLAVQKVFNTPGLAAWNFGPKPESCVSVRTLVEACNRWFDSKLNWQVIAEEWHEAQRLELDFSKAKHELNWSPKLDFSETIEWTIAWYARHLVKDDVLAFSKDQILTYLKR